MTENSISSGYNVRPVQTVDLPSEPLRERGASITETDYNILLEGSDTSMWAGRRNTALGVVGSTVVAMIGLLSSAQFKTESGLNPFAIGALCAFAVILAVSVVLAIVFWLELKRTKGRESFAHCRERIERQFSGISAAAAARLAKSGMRTEATMGPSVSCWKLDFAYLPESPTDHGWKLAGRDPSALPDFEARDDKVLGTCLRVNSKGRYALDYILGRTEADYKRIEFVTQLGFRAKLYVWVEMSRERSPDSKSVWFRFDPDLVAPQSITEEAGECGIPLDPYKKENGWEYVRRNLSEVVKRTYGKFGWRLGSVGRFRIRGELSLAYIVLY